MRTSKAVLSPLPFAFAITTALAAVEGTGVTVLFRQFAELVPARNRAVQRASQSVLAQQYIADPVAAVRVAVLRAHDRCFAVLLLTQVVSTVITRTVTAACYAVLQDVQFARAVATDSNRTIYQTDLRRLSEFRLALTVAAAVTAILGADVAVLTETPIADAVAATVTAVLRADAALLIELNVAYAVATAVTTVIGTVAALLVELSVADAVATAVTAVLRAVLALFTETLTTVTVAATLALPAVGPTCVAILTIVWLAGVIGATRVAVLGTTVAVFKILIVTTAVAAARTAIGRTCEAGF